jgi:hypothetical protein
MNRNLMFVPVGTGLSYNNFKISVLDAGNTIHWGGSSEAIDPSKKKMSKFHKDIFSNLKIGDVVLFVQKGKCEVSGVVTGLRVDLDTEKTIGWLPGDRTWDLVIEMTKVPIFIERVLSVIPFQGTPNSSLIVSKLKATDFWTKYEETYTQYAVSQVPVIQPKTVKKESYRDIVNKSTEMTWRNHSNELSPDGVVRSVDWQLDHMYAVANAEAVGVPAHITASKHNLALIYRENSSKGCRNSQKLSELLAHFDGYDYLLEREQKLISQGKMPWQRYN